ncbi:MAG: hypothetical protein IPF52_14420 [Saprospiraceae bacterium]|nr:hypothetical protein [Saprospiraceae bacterium]
MNLPFQIAQIRVVLKNRILPAFTSCSGACVINAVVSNITCDNNGTATNTNDDRFFFDLEVTGFNTSASYTFYLIILPEVIVR